MSQPSSQWRWSPITCLPKQTLTQAGLINLDTTDNEVQLLSRTAIELRSLSPMPLAKPAGATAAETAGATPWNDRDADLTVTLTTHRIVFESNDAHGAGPKRRPHFLHHCAIKHTTVQSTGGKWTSNRSSKIFLETLTHGDFHFIFRKGQKDRDAFLDHLQKALTRRQWEETYRAGARAGTHVGAVGFGAGSGIASNTGNRVGVEAILQRNQNRHDRAAKLTQQAFGKGTKKPSKDSRTEEVEVLFREAKELTAIIHKYVATLEKNQKGGDGDEKEDTTELTSMLQGMGMVTALAKDSASSGSFHELLARQICDFLNTNKNFMMEKGGSGIMTLTDVYCLYNRARGANMLSPEDLIEALKKMESLGLGMKLREFDDSGVMVLQECNFDDSVMAKKLIDYMEDQEGSNSNSGGFMDFIMGGVKVEEEGKKAHVGLTSLEAARVLKISPLLANEQLLSAERNGYLCRDVTLEGTRFYQNRLVSSF
jgi:ESCRT-II complex subunit VPS36